jgi:ABC-type Zn uptake system ZnuABC Zn-binding protein ZnuA
VRKLDVPSQLDRAQGDVHAAGNPHIQTDPRNIAPRRDRARRALQQIDPAHAADYAQAPGRLRAALAAGERALGGAGGAAEGTRSSRSTRRSSICTTGSA